MGVQTSPDALKAAIGPRDRTSGGPRRRGPEHFPRVVNPADPEMQQPQHNPRPAPGAPGLTAAARILVVQPAPGHDADVRALLNAAGETPQVLSADNVAVAVDLALQRPIDVAVLIAAGGRAGDALEDVVELQARCPELPVVVLTAIDDRELALSALDRKSTRLNSSHIQKSRMPSSA